MDNSQFRQSDNIEDRRRMVYDPPLGPFGTPGEPNVFETGNGTMAAFNAGSDFVPQPNSPSQLSIDAGINNLPAANGTPIFARPPGLLSGTAPSIINAESGGDPNAQNPNSSASGPGQFLDSTWLDTLKAHRPDIAQGQSDDTLLSLKNDPKLAADMTAAYAGDNQAVLSKAGLPVTPGSTYLAHFAGPGGAVKVMQADPNAPVSDILGPAVMKANPFLAGMTAQGLQAWAAKKMGASAPVAGAQPQGSPAPGNGPPTSLAPPPAAPVAPPPQMPIFAQAPQPAPQQPPMMPPPQAAPIFAAQRKPIDLSGLRAALAARAPIFPGQGQNS